MRPLRGKYGNYTLHVEARDLGTPSNKDDVTLEICVTDYNDNAPLFVSPQHNTTIRVPEVRLSFADLHGHCCILATMPHEVRR